METRETDVAIIGAGSAGLNARREVLRLGGKPLLIESGPYGTTCARVGCMPSKLLIAAADVAHEVSRAGVFGLEIANGHHVNGRSVMERVRRERDRFVSFVVESTEAIPSEQRLRGHARFLGPTTLQVDDHTIVESSTVIVAAGSHPFVPPPFDLIREHVMVNDDVFELEDLPASVAVIGTGIIALELGQALHRLGVRVAFFNPFDELGPFTDPEVTKVVKAVLSAELRINLGATVINADVVADGIRVRWADADGEEHEDVFARILAAAGRRPNLAGLDLDKTNLPLNERGLPPLNPQTAQAGDSPIFFAGDIDGHLPLLHEAADDGRIAGSNAMLYPNVVAHVRRVPLAVAFTDPQMAMLGVRYTDLPEGGFAVGQVSFEDQGRARVMGRNQGIARIYADKSCCRLIGAEVFGPSAEHIAHLLAWSVQQGLTVQTALSMPFYHPVVEEGVRTALRDLAGNLQILDGCPAEDLVETPGM
jgi:dihydrolipoamide dehydrogenase